jgi:hypothetical protein
MQCEAKHKVVARSFVTSQLEEPQGYRESVIPPAYWVPFTSPLTTHRDYGGGILTRLQTGRATLFLGDKIGEHGPPGWGSLR